VKFLKTPDITPLKQAYPLWCSLTCSFVLSSIYWELATISSVSLQYGTNERLSRNAYFSILLAPASPTLAKQDMSTVHIYLSLSKFVFENIWMTNQSTLWISMYSSNCQHCIIWLFINQLIRILFCYRNVYRDIMTELAGSPQFSFC
jgi:hypothetical protein